MKQLLTMLMAAMFAAVSVAAVAQEKKADAKKEMKAKTPTAAQKKRQERMKECNAQADEKKLQGDERKKFVSTCAKPAAKKATKKTDKK